MNNSTLIKKLSMKAAGAALVLPIGCIGASTIMTLLVAPSTSAATLNNGSLEVTIREDNGAIDTVLFGGSDFYNPGSPVSNFGFQVGEDTSTFVRNTTTGGTGQSVNVTSSDHSVVVKGTFTGVDFSRTYSLVDGLNVLRVTTEFTNKGEDIALRYFDTFDPDQGVDQGNEFETFNDVLTLSTEAGSAKVGQATETGDLTVVMGSLNSDAVVASGGPFEIFDGSDLNDFFAFPVDGNGTFADQGTHVGVELSLAAGASGSFIYDQAYGTSIEAAQGQFISANLATSEPDTSVPEPASVLGLLAVGAFGAVSKLKSQQEA